MKIIRNLCISILLLFLIFVSIYQKEIRTLKSLELVDERGFYHLQYHADYNLDELLSIGVENDQDLIQFASKQILKGAPIDIEVPEIGCSVFSVQNKYGEYIMGRNFDLDMAPVLLVHSKAKGSYENYSFTSLSLLGIHQKEDLQSLKNKIKLLAAPLIPMDGINEKGLSIAVLLLKDQPTQQKTGRIPLTTSVVIRTVLDKAKTIEEAIDIFKNYDMQSSANANYHFMISDANGDSVIIEYVDNEAHYVYPDKDYQIVTNFYVAKTHKQFQGTGQDRYQIIQEAIEKQPKKLDLDASMNILKSVHRDKYSLDDTIRDTLWSVIYNNSQASLDVSVLKNYQNKYHYSLK